MKFTQMEFEFEFEGPAKPVPSVKEGSAGK